MKIDVEEKIWILKSNFNLLSRLKKIITKDTRRHSLIFSIFLFFGLCINIYMLHNNIIFAQDDAFINYKYAKNFAEGNGLVFNKGERVWGFTSPINTLLLGIFTALGLNTHQISITLGIAFIVLSSFILYLILSDFFHPIFAIFVSLHFLFNGTGHYQFLALETNALIFTQLSFLYFIQKKEYSRACLVAAISCLVRPDSILLVIPIMIIHRKCFRLNHFAYFAVPGLAWLIFAGVYYQTLLPNTFYAKKEFSSLWHYLQFKFFRIFLYDGIFPSILDKKIGAAICIVLSIFSLIRLEAQRYKSMIYALVIYPWIVYLAYGLIGAPPRHPWEVFSAKFFFWLSIFFGLGALVHWFCQFLNKKHWKAPAYFLAAGFLGLYFFFIILPDAGELFSYLKNQENAYYRGGRHACYLAVSEWINQNTDDYNTLAAPEVGTLGYYTKLHMIDFSGLITKTHVGGEKLNRNQIIEKFQPDYLLIFGNVSELHNEDPGAKNNWSYYRVKYFDKMGGYTSLSLLKNRG